VPSRAPATIDRVVIREDIVLSERTLAYRIEGRNDGQWFELSSGTNVGHKRIDRFPPRSVEAVKLVITESKARPCIKEFAIFNVNEAALLE
jgi:hypothetical protein